MPWRCEFCTFINYRDTFLACEMCGVSRTGMVGNDSKSEGLGFLQVKSGEVRQPAEAMPGPMASPLRSAGSQSSNEHFPVEDGRVSSPVLGTRMPTQSFDEMMLSGGGEFVIEEGGGSHPSPVPSVRSEASSQHPPPPPVKAAAVVARTTKGADERTQLLEEIIESERAYVDLLCTLVTHFLQPLQNEIREGNMIVTEKTLQGIFSNVSQLMSVNVELLRVMEGELGRDDGPKTSDMLSMAITKSFKEILPFFKMYSWYVNNYPTAVELLKSEQSQNKRFAKYLAEKHAHEICKGLDLGAYLIMPVQRLCKYPLLFSRLIKETPTENHDFADIKHVSEVVNQVTSTVDLDRGRAEKALRGFEIANFISLESLSKRMGEKVQLLQPGRTFEYEFSCFLSRSSGKRAGNELKPRTVFLFSDRMLIAKKGSKGYDARSWIDLAYVRLGDLAPSPSNRNSLENNPPPDKERSGRGWTPTTIMKKSTSASGPSSSSSSSGNAGSVISSPSNGSTNTHPFQFSALHEAKAGQSISGRLSLGRVKSSKNKYSETLTFYFADDYARKEAHRNIAEAIRSTNDCSNIRPGSSHGTSMPMNTIPIGETTRRTRSLSPQSSPGRTKDQVTEETDGKARPTSTPSLDNPFAKAYAEPEVRPKSNSVSEEKSQSKKVGKRTKTRPPAPTKSPSRPVAPGLVNHQPTASLRQLATPPPPPRDQNRLQKFASSSSSVAAPSSNGKPRPKAPQKPMEPIVAATSSPQKKPAIPIVVEQEVAKPMKVIKRPPTQLFSSSSSSNNISLTQDSQPVLPVEKWFGDDVGDGKQEQQRVVDEEPKKTMVTKKSSANTSRPRPPPPT